MEERAELITAVEAAKILGISCAHFRRMTDSGAAPSPIRLGRTMRWRRTGLMEWIADGCPDLRKRRRPAKAGAR